MSIVRLKGVTLSCPEPAELAEFYRRLTGGEVVLAARTSSTWRPTQSGWHFNEPRTARHRAGLTPVTRGRCI